MAMPRREKINLDCMISQLNKEFIIKQFTLTLEYDNSNFSCAETKLLLMYVCDPAGSFLIQTLSTSIQ